MLMIQKGKEYKEKVQEKVQEKREHETDGCTFVPELNKRYNVRHGVNEKLYTKRSLER